jgi:hypothetical protein
VILVMSATGAALALKPQILNDVERDVRFIAPQEAERLPASRLIGAPVAGIASLGGVVLVWTGIALALRRLLGRRVWNRVAATARARTAA